MMILLRIGIVSRVARLTLDEEHVHIIHEDFFVVLFMFESIKLDQSSGFGRLCFLADPAAWTTDSQSCYG